MRVSWSAPAIDDLRAIDRWLTLEASPDHALRTLLSVRERAVGVLRLHHEREDWFVEQ